MAGISFLSNNFVDSSVVSLTTGTENSQFPLDNIKNQATAVKFRSLENSIVVVFDLQQTRTIDTIAIHGDTNDSLGLTTASVKTSLTTDFSGATAIPITLSAEHIMGYEYITEVSHRYVELTLTGTGVYAEVSNVFVGQRVELLQQNISIASFGYGFSDKSTKSSNKYGQQFIDARNKIKTLSGEIQYCIKSEQEELDDMFLRHGMSVPLWLIIDKDSSGMNDGQYKLTSYGYFEKMPTWSASGGQTYNTKIKVIQAG